MKLETLDFSAFAHQHRWKRGKATLALYMNEHFDEVEKAIGEHADWVFLTELFAKAGLRDAKGNLPTPGTASQTWYRVRRKRVEKPPIADNQPPIRLLNSTHRREPDGSSLKISSPRPALPPAVKANEDSKAGAPSLAPGAAEKLRRLRDSISSRELQMPDRIDPAGGNGTP